MRHLACRLLPTFAVVSVLCGCGALDHRPVSAPGGVPGTASTGANGEPSREILPADRVADANADTPPPHETRPVDRKLGLNLHIFGLSYHPDRAGTHARHLDNEINVGLGLGYKIRNDARGNLNVETGIFKDSGRNWAKFAGVGYQFKLSDHWLLGADLLAIQSPTYNYGRAFIAPVPRLTYDFGAVKINATYVPKVVEFNQFDIFFIYLTVPLLK